MAQSYDPVARLSELISGIGIATLTTISPDGSLHSCPMAAPRRGGSRRVVVLVGQQYGQG